MYIQSTSFITLFYCDKAFLAFCTSPPTKKSFIEGFFKAHSNFFPILCSTL